MKAHTIIINFFVGYTHPARERNFFSPPKLLGSFPKQELVPPKGFKDYKVDRSR
jgi:hypothetical protein